MLSAWDSFYVMMGSSAAALTGLVFVVVTLVRDEDRRGSRDGLETFTTPTVFHFCGALFVAALMSAPFRSLVPIAIVLGLAGAWIDRYPHKRRRMIIADVARALLLTAVPVAFLFAGWPSNSST